MVELVRATRHKSEGAPDFVKKYVNYGASVRAAQFIVLAAKARALSRRRYHVTYEDIRRWPFRFCGIAFCSTFMLNRSGSIQMRFCGG